MAEGFFNPCSGASPKSRRHWCAFVALAMLSGCSCSTQTDIATANTNDRVATADRTHLPVVTETEDEIRAEMRQYEPFSAEFEDARIRLVVLKNEILKREGVEGVIKETPIQHGGDQQATVDPETGKLAWRAMTCFNPNCTGQGKGGGPLLFVRTFSNVTLGADGKMIVAPLNMAELEQNPFVCPVCGEEAFIRPYDSPETELRKRELMDQLDAVRGAKGKGGRTVKEIVLEIANLPKLFLVPEE